MQIFYKIKRNYHCWCNRVTSGTWILLCNIKDKISKCLLFFLVALLWIMTLVLKDKTPCMIRDSIFSLQRQYLSSDGLCISESLPDNCEPTIQQRWLERSQIYFPLSFMQRQKGDSAKGVFLPPFSLKMTLNSVLPSLSRLLTWEAALIYGSEESKYSDSWSAY